MKKEKIVELLIKNLKKIRPIKKVSKNDIQNFNFIDSGHIDSFEIVKFNFELEKKFKIKFTPNDLSLKKFKTISGLSDIIYKKISKKIR